MAERYTAEEVAAVLAGSFEWEFSERVKAARAEIRAKYEQLKGTPVWDEERGEMLLPGYSAASDAARAWWLRERVGLP